MQRISSPRSKTENGPGSVAHELKSSRVPLPKTQITPSFTLELPANFVSDSKLFISICWELKLDSVAVFSWSLPFEADVKSGLLSKHAIFFNVCLQANPNELTNGVINAAFMLLFKDSIRLFAAYNEGVINLLGKMLAHSLL